MYRFLLAPIISVISMQHSAADTEFEDSVPVETFKAFISSSNTDVLIYSDIMDDFPEFQVPFDFAVVGSIDWVINRRVVLETQLNEDQAIGALVISLTNEGWRNLPSLIVNSNQFAVPYPGNELPRYTEICHEQHGVMRLDYSSRSNRNLVWLGISSYQRQETCEEQISGRTNPDTTRQQQNIGQEMMEYAPRLEEPVQQPRIGFMNPFYSVNGKIAERKNTIEIDWSIADVYEYFADQIAEQGWELDSQIVGNVSAIGNWTRSPELNLDLIGMLTIIDSGSASYELRLTLIFPSDFGVNRN